MKYLQYHYYEDYCTTIDTIGEGLSSNQIISSYVKMERFNRQVINDQAPTFVKWQNPALLLSRICGPIGQSVHNALIGDCIE